MNRIVLIGNGFDLAHGLESDYKSFLDWYLQTKITEVKNIKNHIFEDEDIKITHHYNIKTEFEEKIKWSDLKDKTDFSGFSFEINNNFLSILKVKQHLQNWVDIEHEYFLELRKFALMSTLSYIDRVNHVCKLNAEFFRIKLALKRYLEDQLKIKKIEPKSQIQQKIYSKFSFKDFSVKGFKLLLEYYESVLSKYAFDPKVRMWYSVNPYNGLQQFIDSFCVKIEEKQECKIDLEKLRNKLNNTYNNFQDIDIFEPAETLLLNFNYTSIVERYRFKEGHNSPVIINIHGQLENEENPMIFGYGDEIGADYAKIEELNLNEFLENVKSIRYSDTNNYKKLLEFVESDHYQIMIMGHSCGNSDRTLLNTLFEHPNCASIKFYYYKNEKGEDNYSDVIRNISRNFNSKATMRDRVVNKMSTEELVKSM